MNLARHDDDHEAAKWVDKSPNSALAYIGAQFSGEVLDGDFNEKDSKVLMQRWMISQEDSALLGRTWGDTAWYVGLLWKAVDAAVVLR
jgi:hypothetical protein